MKKILVISAAIVGMLSLSACHYHGHKDGRNHHSPTMYNGSQYNCPQYGHHRGQYRW